MYLVRSGAISGFEAAAQVLGANPVQLIRDVGLSYAQFRDPNSYISYSKMSELLERCALQCSEPLFGLLLAETENPGVLGDLPITVSQEPTVSQALTALDRYIYLFANGVHITQVPLGSSIQLAMKFDFQTPLGLNQLIQFSVANLANITARLMNADRYSLQLNLTQADPAQEQPARTQQGFYPQTQFSSSFDGVLLPASALMQKTHFDEAAIQHHFREQLGLLQQRYPNSLQNQARAIIGQLLPSGECCIEKVAANLDIHHRMLQLKLQEENTNYQTLLRDVRQSIAKQHLEQSPISITDLALNLGYADISVFSRNFKTWTGFSPKQWRKDQCTKSNQAN
ncbi:AraC family transcriptional regulator [Pseudomaricurvus alkylphenolicus]|uniref:AraC family transcriptional regulator n=1 Tax=Pseudomaricurvus alkylphenolicus TaxID=1306991 RepID=UPI001421E04C|nr:AraC family transcriptional regulator [Pseudomaricurvus alkylphenolicus]NIB44126.1 AraC family transcriptional regulator [Pseudomaricurvus alkylphenolicus]